MKDIILIGGGGHCHSCIDVIEAEGKYRILGVLELPELLGSKIMDYEVIGTDDDKICSRAAKYNVEAIKRPSHLAEDSSLVFDRIKYTVNVLGKNNFKPDYIFLPETTSPLRSKRELEEAIKALNNGYQSVASLCETVTPPSRVWVINNNIIKPVLGDGLVTIDNNTGLQLKMIVIE